MERRDDFTQGAILPALTRFALPVLLALFLQAMYGAVDLQVVGNFGTAADISAVSTGSQILQTITMVICGLAMGVTVLLGQRIGEGRGDEGGRAVGGGHLLLRSAERSRDGGDAGVGAPDVGADAGPGGGLRRDGGIRPHLLRGDALHRGL